MTKEECIEKAYGEFWGFVKEWVDSDGWFDYKKAGFFLSKYFGTETYDEVSDGYNCTFIQRPKTLKGITDNYGWFKIECVDDLPKEDCTCWVLDKIHGVVSGRWETPPTEKDFKEASEFWLKRTTHYKIIPKPELPKY
jgi:hypothetical protein